MKKKTRKNNKTGKSRPEPKAIAALRKKAEKKLKEQAGKLDELSEKDVRQLVHELGTHQIELEMQNEELRRAQNELEASRSKYSDLYDFSPIGYFTFDKSGRICDVNLTGANLLGIERSNLINKPFPPFIDRDDRNVFHSHCTEVLKKHTLQTCEIRLRKKDGSGFYAQLQSIPIKDSDGNAVYCRTALSDIFERKRAEKEIKKINEELEERVKERTSELLTLNKELEAEIADRTRAEEALKTERQRLYGVMETLPVYVVLLTPDYHVSFANRFFRERFGESHGRRCFEYLFERSEPCEICETYNVLKTMEPHHWEWTGPDGRNYDIYDFPFTDADGSTLILEMGIDITERKRAEESLRNTSELLEKVFSITHVKVAYMDKNFNFIRVNRAYAASDEKEPEYFVGKNHFELFPYGENEKIFRKVVETGEPYFAFERAFEYAGYPERGVTYWDWSLLPVREADGSVSGTLLTLIDVTERKRAEEKLSLFNELINQSSDAIFVVEPETSRLLEINDAACSYLGYSCEELLYMKVTDLAEKQPDHERWKAHVREVKEKGFVLLEDRLRRKDGTTFPVEVGAKYVALEKEDYLVAIARDITERRETEKRTKVTNDLLKLFAQKISRREYLDAVVELIHLWSGCHCAGIRILDDMGNIPYASYTGFSHEFWESENMISVKRDSCACTRVITETPEPQDRPMMTPFGSFYSNNTIKFLNILTEEEKTRFRGVCIRSGFLSVAVIPIRYQGKVFGAIHLADEREGMVPLKKVEFIENMAFIIGEAIYRFGMEDEKVLLKADALRTAQLASIGELAAGVAHEINNPINGIINYAQMLVNKLAKDSSEHGIANRIIKEGNRITNIVRGLLSFARKGKEEKEIVTIAALLHDTMLLTETQILKDNIKLIINIPDDLPEIIANAQQIQQVFLNVINNARYALNQKYPSGDGDKILEISGEKVLKDNQPYVRLIFHDHGAGIPEDMMDKVMNPFFSTKPRDKGTGLGLSISYGIIDVHGGKLMLESVEGEFTKIIIDLPGKDKKQL